MKKRLAMSAMGYGIVSVIILGIIMIISAPMLVNNTKKEKEVQTPSENAEMVNPENPEYAGRGYDYSELQNLVERMNSRIENLENRQPQQQTQTETNKYICTMEGALDASGEVIPLESPNRTDKIVFVCQYNQ